MIKYVSTLILISVYSCQAQTSVIQDHVMVEIYTYKAENTVKAAAMPEIKRESKLIKYKRRFDYLLLNISELHHPDKLEERNKICNLYPDTLKLKRLYLQKYIQDKKLAAYFKETLAPISNSNLEINKIYAMDELMDVASKIFLLRQSKSKQSIQWHICIGINGLAETNLEKDYTLLSDFCYEAIFNILIRVPHKFQSHTALKKSYPTNNSEVA